MFTTLLFITLLLISKILKATPCIDHALVILVLLASFAMKTFFVDQVLVSLTFLMLFNIVYKTIHMGARPTSVKDEVFIDNKEVDAQVKDENPRPIKSEIEKQACQSDQQTRRPNKGKSIFRAPTSPSKEEDTASDMASDTASDTTLHGDTNGTAEKPNIQTVAHTVGDYFRHNAKTGVSSIDDERLKTLIPSRGYTGSSQPTKGFHRSNFGMSSKCS